MHFQAHLDSTHSVIRLTAMEEMVSLECAEDVYQRLSPLKTPGSLLDRLTDLARLITPFET